MSDEIDIEEHDVMDNPTIKRIFPDLSVIKKEINQYNYDEDFNSPSKSAPLEDSSQGDQITTDSKDQLRKHIQSRNELFTSNTFHASEAMETRKPSGCLYENIIILGTKPNLECQENIHNSLRNEPKLILKNLNPFLNRCKRYCKICLRLFPKGNLFNLHMINVHTKRKNRIELMGKQVGHKLYKCNVCDKILSSQSNLWRHFRNLHGDVKKFKTVDRSDKERVANEASHSKTATGSSCFHCQQLFPTQSSLIEHLYEVLEPNKTGSNDESTNSSTVKEQNRKVNHKDQLIDDGRVKLLNDSYLCFENNLVVNSPLRSRDKVHTDKNNSESSLPEKNNPRRRSIDSIVESTEYGDENIKMKKRKANNDPLNTDTKSLFTEQFNSKKEIAPTRITSIHGDKSNETNKSKFTPKNETKKPSASMFYKCFICSKYFNNATSEFYSRHIMNDHKIKEVTEMRMVPFDSQCQFCPSTFSGMYTYNAHLCKYHKNQLKRDYSSPEEHPGLKNDKKVYKNYQFALKNILYKCIKCDLYFLSSNEAMEHSKHSGVLDTWKCSDCQRMFRKGNKVLHEKQHCFSKTITVHTLTEFSQILYKCSNCTVHYSETNFLLHYVNCDSETPNSLYCKVCDILINRDDMECHGISHKETNIPCSDFIIIEPNIIDDRHVLSNTDKAEHYKSDMTSDKNFCPHTPDREKGKDMIVEIERHESPNAAAKKKDKSDMIDDRNISQNTTGTIIDKPDMIDNRYEKPNRTKTKNNIVKRSRFGNESLVEYSKLAMSFCHTCKCFIGNMNLRKLHVEGKCGHMVKFLCKGCGLLLTAKTHETHKEYHKKEQISLHDYRFYDLKTEKRICPPIPEYPKCNSCEVNFLRNSDVKTHSCQEQDYITCNVCFMKLTDQAYKLHIHFHSYAIPSEKAKLKDTALQSKTTNKILQVEPISNVPDDPYISDIFYTCKSCQVTVDTYDKVVQHCHDHYNSEVVKLNMQKCQNCTFIFLTNDYKTHLSVKCNNDLIKVVDFDPFYFRHNNDFWENHIFAYLADEDISKILRNSMYRYECRLKLEKIQSGSSNSVLFKCDKCQVFIDPQYLYMHAKSSGYKPCDKFRKHPCALCGLYFSSTAYRIAHEKDHESIEMNLKSHIIVLYNKEEHESYNKIMYNANNRYILYQCRNCERVVDKFDRNAHKCVENNLKLCCTCGLLLDKKDFDLHFIRHEELDKFDTENIIVVMFGKSKLNCLGKKKLSSTFSGTKYDYTMYKCTNCDLCLRAKECISEHVCLFDNTKCKCTKCGLYFSELDFKYHYEVHEKHLDFDDLSMNLIDFALIDPNDKLGESIDKEEVKDDKSCSPEKQETIYKCDCGLHFLEELNAQQHARNCNARMKISKQSCSKCDLLFTPGELFNHLLKHHCDKKLQLKFNIVIVSKN